jgi:hypothetical protein
MNIDRVGQFAYESFKKIGEKKISDKGNSPEKGTTAPAKDGFVKNENIENQKENLDQLSAFAKAAPDVRDAKLSEISKRISQGYYSSNAFSEDFSGKLVGII